MLIVAWIPYEWSGTIPELAHTAVTTALVVLTGFLLVHRLHQRRANRRDRENQYRLNIALEGAELALWDWQLPSGQLVVDEWGLRMLGYAPGSIPRTADGWLELVHPDDSERVREVMQMRARGESVREVEYRVRMANGNWRWVHERGKVVERDRSGTPVRVAGTLLDVTANKEVEEEMRRLFVAIEQAAEGILMTDAAGIIQYVNPAFEQVSGYSRREAIGRKPNFLKSGRQDRAFYTRMWEQLAAGRVWRGRFVNRAKSGALFEEEATISPIRSQDGRITHYVAVKRDVTHESELERQLRQAQKMEALGTLAGGIAHDFNNILSPILGYTELILQDTQADHANYASLQEIYKGARRATDLVAQILTFSRRREHERRPMLIHPVLKEALKLLQGTLPSTIRILQHIDESCRPVVADSTQIHQVIMNLCMNAYHAMRSGGGTLDVSLAEEQVVEPETAFGLTVEPGAYVCLQVRDSGCGIGAEIIDRIFDPYFTTKQAREGTGLGLAMVHGIVKSSAGGIGVNSTLGEGTTFRIMLPVCLPSGAEEAEADTAEPLPRGAGQRVLVVDDEEAISQLEEILLRQLGYEVDTYTSSIDALAAFSAAPDRFAAALTDQTMPNLTGDELARRLLAIRPDLPIVLCSGFSETVTPDTIREIGIREYLRKPMTARQLAEVMHKALNDTPHDDSPDA
jgi:PAS domain S-box-containing protein